MISRNPVMLTPADPVWAELVQDIEAVVALGFAFDAQFARIGRTCLLITWIGGSTSLAASVTHSRGLLLAMFWTRKPQKQWLDGVFTEAILENGRAAGFKAMVEDMANSPGMFEELDGDHLAWDDLSAAARLQCIVRDAVIAGAPFESFAEVVKSTIGDAAEAALRVVLESQKELHAIANLLRNEDLTPPPLVDQVTHLVDYVSDLEAQQDEHRLNREKALEGINNVGEGNSPQRQSGRGAISHGELNSYRRSGHLPVRRSA